MTDNPMKTITGMHPVSEDEGEVGGKVDARKMLIAWDATTDALQATIREVRSARHMAGASVLVVIAVAAVATYFNHVISQRNRAEMTKVVKVALAADIRLQSVEKKQNALSTALADALEVETATIVDQIQTAPAPVSHPDPEETATVERRRRLTRKKLKAHKSALHAKMIVSGKGEEAAEAQMQARKVDAMLQAAEF